MAPDDAMGDRRAFIKKAAAAGMAVMTKRILAAGEVLPGKKPNIVLLLADDLGYECIGANGGTSYKTPAIDKLAAGGVRFEHCYSQALCTP